MPSCVVTDNRHTAELRFPGERVVSDIVDVINLEPGTTVKILQLATGRVIDGPCHAARVMIDRGDLLEDGE